MQANPDFSQRNPENRDKANPAASQRRFGIGHIRNSMLAQRSLAVPCIISLITILTCTGEKCRLKETLMSGSRAFAAVEKCIVESLSS